MSPSTTSSLAEAGVRAATCWADRPALTSGGETSTYRELHQQIARLAGGLGSLGIGEGSRLAIMIPNSPEFILTYMAASHVGATVVPVPSLLGVEEVAYILGDVGADAMVVAEQLAPVAHAAMQQADTAKTLIVCGDAPEPDAVGFAELMASAEPLTEPATIAAETPAAIIYTSGTTGRPKGAVLTHRNLLTNVEACRQAISISEEDIFVTVLPLFHSFGATVSMLLPMFCGCHNVLLPGFSALHALQAIERHRATIVAGVPTMYALMMQVRDASAHDLSSLRFVVSGGAALPDEVCLGFEKTHGAPIIEGYGPTEASPVVSVNPIDGRRKVGSVGLPLPGVEIMIADDDMAELPAGEIGEICVRGPNVMAGYHNADELTKATLVNDWLRTGDVGKLDEDGYLYIVDRKKDLIIVGGINVYPCEVEDCIARMAQVAEVAVAGAPSELRGEVVAAHVVVKEGAECTAQQVIDHCRQHLAPYKVPKHVRFADELAKSAIGKVLKQELKSDSEIK